MFQIIKKRSHGERERNSRNQQWLFLKVDMTGDIWVGQDEEEDELQTERLDRRPLLPTGFVRWSDNGNAYTVSCYSCLFIYTWHPNDDRISFLSSCKYADILIIIMHSCVSGYTFIYQSNEVLSLRNSCAERREWFTCRVVSSFFSALSLSLSRYWGLELLCCRHVIQDLKMFVTTSSFTRCVKK